MSAVSDDQLDQLVQAGFQIHNAGSFNAGFQKRLVAQDMPYISEHVVDNDNVFESTEVLVEVSITGEVTLRICDFEGGNEGPVNINSDEGKSILRDAGVKLDS